LTTKDEKINLIKKIDVKKETKIVPNKAAGAAILSAVNSPPSPKLVQQSTTVTNTDKFNTNDLVEFLNMRNRIK
jgi:hypothetical protein